MLSRLCCDHAVRAVGVAVVDDLDVVEDLQPVAEVVGAGLVGVAAQRSGAEAGAGSVGRPEVERGADDGDIGLPRVELLGRRQQRSLGERHDRAEGVALVELFLVAGGQVALGSLMDGHGNRDVRGAGSTGPKSEAPRAAQPAEAGAPPGATPFGS